VVAETPNGIPLLVAGEYGAGRVLAMAGNSTIRWWRHGRETEHKRFWRQVVLWLVHREDLEEHDVWIKLDQRRFNPGSRVVFTAGAKDPQGDELPDAEYRVTVTGPDGRTAPLVVSHDKNQIVGAVEQVKQPGDYAVNVVVSYQGKEIGKAQGEFVVFDHDVELSNPSADHAQLARMAETTARFGGRVVAAEELPSLLDEIRRRPPEMEFEVPIKWQIGDTAPDAWTFFLLLVGLFSVEWALRKKWGLI
jgi:hypothetical protein